MSEKRHWIYISPATFFGALDLRREYEKPQWHWSHNADSHGDAGRTLCGRIFPGSPHISVQPPAPGESVCLECAEALKNPKETIQTLAFVSLAQTHPVWDRLMDFDLKLTTHDGVSLYTKEQSLAEIERHRWKLVEKGFGKEYGDLLQAIDALPDGVLIRW